MRQRRLLQLLLLRRVRMQQLPAAGDRLQLHLRVLQPSSSNLC